MCAGRSWITAVLIFLFVLAPACVTTTAPRNWLPKSSEIETNTYGAWISVEYQEDDTRKNAHGELIAVEPDNIIFLTERGARKIHKVDIFRGKVTFYDVTGKASGLAFWTLAGVLSTGTHGFFLIFSAPVWLAFGIGATVGESRAPQIMFPQNPWEEIRKYARFPQGLPSEIELQSLEMKR